MDKSIFNINEDYLRLVEKVVENEGELTPELEKELEINDEDFEQKVENYSKIIHMLESKARAAKEEEKRIKAIRVSREKAISRYTDRIDQAMRLRNKDSFETDTVKVSYRKSTYLDLEPDMEIPPKYQRISIRPDKTMITDALKKGEKIEGAELKERQNIQIK